MNQYYYYVVALGVVILLFLLINIIPKKIDNIKIKLAGKRGELKTRFLINHLVKRRGGYVLSNVVLPLYDSITEIDLVIILDQGVICVENKHLTGKIVGNEFDHDWHQYKEGNVKKKLYNPIMQNEGHIKCLSYHLNKAGLKNVPVLGYVVFSSPKSNLTFNYKNVGLIKGLRKYIKKVSKNKKIMDASSIKKVINEVKK